MLPESNEFPIIQIEIAKIKFLNPRTRNKVVHEEIKESIKKRGLSKPISVRAIDEDDFKYALICGQGRIEALVALGETIIPAIIRDVSEEDAYVMSLVENIARRRPRSNELLQIIKDMKNRGLSDSEISEITGYSSNWVSSINMLLDKESINFSLQSNEGICLCISQCNLQDVKLKKHKIFLPKHMIKN